MSGGSYDYIGWRLSDIKIENSDVNPKRMAFQELLKLVADALTEIEWVDSGDTSPGDEDVAIDKCMAFLNPVAVSSIYKAVVLRKVTTLIQSLENI